MPASALANFDHSRTSPSAGRMELRRFVAPTMAQCLLRMRSEMGLGAVVLSTRTVELKRWLGLLRSQHVEITAGRGLRTMPRRRLAAAPRTQALQFPIAAAPGHEPLSARAVGGDSHLGLSRDLADLRQTIAELTSQVRQGQAPEIPRPLLECYHALRAGHVSEELARQVVLAAAEAAGGELAGRDYARALVCRQIEKRLRSGGALARSAAGRPNVVALIGPTGVGKTTTIAKLAANLMLREGRKVGLITIDTYRIAAIDQLRKYAQIISAPLCVASHPAQMREAIAAMADNDFILIDTAGRSPRDAPKLNELRDFLAAAQPDEVHLVLSTAGAMPSIRLALERFGSVRADRLIFTKLDEVAEAGVILEIVAQTGVPLSYVTHGQDVPNDIEVASPTKLALMMTEPGGGSTAARVRSAIPDEAPQRGCE